jgi:hypothetical protein
VTIIGDNYKKLAKKTKAQINDMILFKNDAKNFFHIIEGEDKSLNGITTQFDCKVFEKNMKKFYETVCIGMVPNLYMLAVCYGIFSIFVFIASISTFYIMRIWDCKKTAEVDLVKRKRTQQK